MTVAEVEEIYPLIWTLEALALSSASADQHDEILARLPSGDLDDAVATLEENWRVGPRVLRPWLETRSDARN